MKCISPSIRNLLLANFGIVISCWHCTGDKKETDQKVNCNIKREPVATILIVDPQRLLELSHHRDHARETHSRHQRIPKVWIFWKYKSSSSCLQIRALTLRRMKSQRTKRHQVLGYFKISITLNTDRLPVLCYSASSDWRWTEGTPVMRLTSGRIRTRIYNICIPFQLIFNLLFYNFPKILCSQIWCCSWLS